MSETSITPRAVVIGLGNVLLGDDAFGPFTVELFRSQYECSPEIEVMDLGTPGLDLTPYLYLKDLVILVDAVSAEGEPGTVRTYREIDFSEFQVPLRLTDHDPGLQESLAHLRLVGCAPLEMTVIGVIPEACVFGGGISSRAVAAASVAIDHIIRSLRQHGLACQRRAHPLRPKLWWNPTHLQLEITSTHTGN